ncbi:MAG: hypothetical protein M1831_007059 [Alyxoria varia]|nr:MAG: hypothetical protein M1831_007059 [Alyxoria varia]
MDPTSLTTASTYLNNLLLARGLLRNGNPIDFAGLAFCMPQSNTNSNHWNKENEPAGDDGAPEPDGKKRKKKTKGDTTTKTTDSQPMIAAQVINLVHDLILRRDRDANTQTSLTSSLQTLRQSHASLQTSHTRLQDAHTSQSRQLSLSQSTVRGAETAARTAEATAKGLREEVGRLKTLLAQVRGQCANDVRRRDVQIEKLKGHLAARQRGNKAGVVGASITIAPGATGRGGGGGVSGGMGSLYLQSQPSQSPPQHGVGSTSSSSGVNGYGEDGQPSLEDAEYSLKQESTEFLTQLSQGLSDENDALIGLVRGAVGTLRELMGLEHNRPRQQRRRPRSQRPDGSENTTNKHHMDSPMVVVSPGDDGTNSNTAHTAETTQHPRPQPADREEHEDDDMIRIPPTSYSTLSTSLTEVLESLTTLLTNPSFAPIEEVQIREEEIQRLRDGWEKMERRWREAIKMMRGWRSRMIKEGMGVGVEELGRGVGVMGMGMPGLSEEAAGDGEEGDGGDGLLDVPGMEEAFGDEEDGFSDVEALRDGEDGTPELPEDEPSFHAQDDDNPALERDTDTRNQNHTNNREDNDNLFDLPMPTTIPNTQTQHSANNPTQLTEKHDTNTKARLRASHSHHAADNHNGERDEEAKENADVRVSAAPNEGKRGGGDGDGDGKINKSGGTVKAAGGTSKIPGVSASKKTSTAAVNNTAAGSTATGSLKAKKPTVASLRARPNNTTQPRATPSVSSSVSAGSTRKKQNLRADPEAPPPQQDSQRSGAQIGPSEQDSTARSEAQLQQQPQQQPHKRQKSTTGTGIATQKRRKRLSVQEKLAIAEREARRVSSNSFGKAKGAGGGGRVEAVVREEADKREGDGVEEEADSGVGAGTCDDVDVDVDMDGQLECAYSDNARNDEHQCSQDAAALSSEHAANDPASMHPAAKHTSPPTIPHLTLTSTTTAIHAPLAATTQTEGLKHNKPTEAEAIQHTKPPEQAHPKPYKRSRPTAGAATGRVTGRPRKRKSTLSPEELENLMLGAVL